ncbi:MAG: RluA family pseudouridine synthase [Oscillospiraceae bacterium]
MRIIDFKVDENNNDKTVGVFLKYVNGVSSRTIRSIKLKENGIMLNGKHIRTVDKISTGDIVSISIEDEPKEYITSDVKVPILYDDDDIIIFNKPSNMPSHQTKKHQEDTLGNVFATYCIENDLKLSFRAINRLDKDTTGAVVVAKNPHSAYRLSQNLQKVYMGITTGELPNKSGTIEAPIDRLNDIQIKRFVSPQGQYAKTDYEVVASGNGHSFVKFKLHTGRTHQIRVHMSYIGYPLLGDEMYGGDTCVYKTQLLHCGNVSFAHPITNEFISVDAPFYDDFTKILKEIF